MRVPGLVFALVSVLIAAAYANNNTTDDEPVRRNHKSEGPYVEMFPELAGRVIKSAQRCKRTCCKLGDRCVTWQFGGGKTNDECRMGGPVRLGGEGSGVSGWCEPNAPRVWSGYIVSRENNKCSAKSEVPGQCFGLGAEVVGADKRRLSVKQCEEKCCGDPKCAIWQALPDRGCFLNNIVEWCDPTVMAYTGGRKCAKGFCMGKESSYEVIEYKGKVQ